MESMDKKEQIIELIKEDNWYNIPVENTTDKIFSILCVSQQRELLLAFTGQMQSIDVIRPDYDIEKYVDEFIEDNNCG